jgi:hypothetical protein
MRPRALVYAEIAHAIGVSPADVELMDSRLSGPDMSLNAPIHEAESGAADRQDFLVDGVPSGPVEGVRRPHPGPGAELAGLLARDGGPITVGAQLRAPAGGREAGWITSATQSARLNRQIALGFVKRGFNSPGSVLEMIPPEDVSGKELTSIEVVALPFI